MLRVLAVPTLLGLLAALIPDIIGASSCFNVMGWSFSLMSRLQSQSRMRSGEQLVVERNSDCVFFQEVDCQDNPYVKAFKGKGAEALNRRVRQFEIELSSIRERMRQLEQETRSIRARCFMLQRYRS